MSSFQQPRGHCSGADFHHVLPKSTWWQEVATELSQILGRHYGYRAAKGRVKRSVKVRRGELQDDEMGKGAADDDYYQALDEWIEFLGGREAEADREKEKSRRRTRPSHWLSRKETTCDFVPV